MAYPPKAKALLGRHHQQEHLEILAAMTSAAFVNSGLDESKIAKGSVALALEIQKEIAAQLEE